MKPDEPILIGDKQRQQEAVDNIVLQTKEVVLAMVKETSKEFDARELTQDQTKIMNDYIVSLTEKLVYLRLEV